MVELCHVLVVLPGDASQSTLGAAQLCKETAATVSKSLKKGVLSEIEGLMIIVDCVDDPIDAVVRLESSDYNALVVPVFMKEHGLWLGDFLGILRDLENPVATYYYRDALAENDDLLEMARHLEAFKEQLESYEGLWLLHPKQRLENVKRVQGEVTDPTVPGTMTAHCEKFLDQTLYDAIMLARGDKKEKHKKFARQVTISENSPKRKMRNIASDEAAAADTQKISDDEGKSSDDEQKGNTSSQEKKELSSSEVSLEGEEEEKYPPKDDDAILYSFRRHPEFDMDAAEVATEKSTTQHLPPERVAERRNFFPTVSVVGRPLPARSAPPPATTCEPPTKAVPAKQKQSTATAPNKKKARKNTSKAAPKTRRRPPAATTQEKATDKKAASLRVLPPPALLNESLWDPSREEILIDDDAMMHLLSVGDEDNFLSPSLIGSLGDISPMAATKGDSITPRSNWGGFHVASP